MIEETDPMLTDSTSREGGQGKVLYDFESWTANITPLPREPRSL